MKIWDLSQETYLGPSNGTFLSYEFRQYRVVPVVAKVRALSFKPSRPLGLLGGSLGLWDRFSSIT
jgi:hypothetical protein